MKRLSIIGVLLSCLLTGAAASAATQTASSGKVKASFSFKGSYPTFRDEILTIAQGTKVLYDKAVLSTSCGGTCQPGSTSARSPSVHVLDLEHDGRPDVVLDLNSGGAHCCSIEQVFSFSPATATYVKTERDFGDPGERIVDLSHDGRYEFLTADDSFAYAFTDYAASGFPIEILTFSNRHFQNVTRSYPTLIAEDANLWLTAYKDSAGDHWQDSVGVIAAWAADEDMLGHSELVSRYLAQQANAGHLNSPPVLQQLDGERFVTALQKFLRAHGYLS
ncbi:MAG: hypothetical protein ACLP8S_27160 [Solirubrobacteraceae bacterium]